MERKYAKGISYKTKVKIIFCNINHKHNHKGRMVTHALDDY